MVQDLTKRPPGGGAEGLGNGAGIGAVQLQAPGDSYFAEGQDDFLGRMDIEYELNLTYQAVGKTAPGSTDNSNNIPDRADARAHPNPFNPSVTVELSVPETAQVKSVIYTVAGRHVRTLINQTLPAGVHVHVWDGRDDRGQPVAAGIYVLESRIGKDVHQSKLVLLK